MLLAGCDSVPESAGATTQAGSGTAGASSGAAGIASEPLEADLTVSGAAPTPVGATFFGQNYWSWVPEWGDPVAGVEAQTAELKLGLLRAGGANNDRQDPTAFSLAEIDDFLAFARQVGAEPLLQVPLLENTAGEAATAQDAADLVTYVNVTQGFGVRYFSIGNEPDLYEEQGMMPAGYDATTFCATFRELAAAMRAVDDTIQIVGPDLSWKYQSGANDWLTPFLQDCGDVTDIVAVHRYPLAPTACTDTAAYADSARYRTVLTHLREILSATGQENKPLAITEGNITWDGDPANGTMAASPGTVPAALWVADNLGVSLEAGLHSVAYWSLSEG
ncbi:MAG: glycoside hydrolase family 44 protein, partial [Gemmatimonadota bacterium]